MARTCKFCGAAVAVPAQTVAENPWSRLVGALDVACAACADAKEAEYRRAELARQTSEAIRDAERSGAVRHGFAQYLTPPAPLVAKNPDNWEYAKRWYGGSVLCCGGEGTGKSSCGRFMLCRALMFGWSVLDINAMAVERSYWMVDRQADVDRAAYARVLLLDDFDRAPWSLRGLNVLREIIDARHEMKRSTIITSNTDVNAMKHSITQAHQGDVIGAQSLLRRLRPIKLLSFTGESYRSEMTPPN